MPGQLKSKYDRAEKNKADRTEDAGPEMAVMLVIQLEVDEIFPKKISREGFGRHEVDDQSSDQHHRKAFAK